MSEPPSAWLGGSLTPCGSSWSPESTPFRAPRTHARSDATVRRAARVSGTSEMVVVSPPPRGGRSPLVIGHRGFPGRFPDNTVAGCCAALDLGADGVEIDIRLCAEGEWVCHHDRSRLGEPVRCWGREHLQREGVPSLAELVAAVPAARWLFVEIKPLPGSDLAFGIGELTRLLMPRRSTTMVLSTSLRVLEAAGRSLPELARSWVVARHAPDRLPAGVVLSPHHAMLERLTGYGVPVHPWTVNDAGRLREVAKQGVASVTTNRPDLALEVLRG